MATPEQSYVQMLADIVVRVGVSTVVAGVLLWFVLDKVANLMYEARQTQLRMEAAIERCCPLQP